MNICRFNKFLTSNTWYKARSDVRLDRTHLAQGMF